jgi:hypothetical protein
MPSTTATSISDTSTPGDSSVPGPGASAPWTETRLASDLAEPAAGPGGGSVVRLIREEWLDSLLDRVDAEGLALTGPGGFLPELVKAVLERGLDAELTGHLGYERATRSGGARRTRATAPRRRRCTPRSGRSG